MSDSLDCKVQRYTTGALVILVVTVLLGAVGSRGFSLWAPRSFVLYAALALYGASAYPYQGWERRSIAQKILYFSFHLALFAGLFRFCYQQNYIFLLAMPLVSQAATGLPWPGTAAVCAGYLIALCLILEGLALNWTTTGSILASVVPSFTFVVAFSLLVKQALIGRNRAVSLAQELEAANAQLELNARHLAELATATERNRIARDIHDGVGHYLTVVTVQLQAALALLPERPVQARESAAKAEAMCRAALAEVRRSVGLLRCSVPEPELHERLHQLIAEGGCPVTIKVQGQARLLSAPMEQAIFRSVQEGLTNVRKHAGATRSEVVLDFQNAEITRVMIRDNGRGSGEEKIEGAGLAGLRERLGLVGGRLEARNHAQGGFSLELELPA